MTLTTTVANSVYFRIHSGEKPFKCNRVDHECSKAFSTPHSLKSHLKTHEKKAQERAKLNSSDKKAKMELTFTASADLYPAGTSSSDDSNNEKFFDNNILQFHIVDGNGNNIKYTTSPTLSFLPSPTMNASMLLQQNTNEAMQLSLANEVEMGSPWVDISVLANKSVLPSTPVTSSCMALSTTIPTFVNLPSYHESYVIENTSENDGQTLLNDFMMTNEFDGEGKTLKSITADAGICQCTNCRCDPTQENGCVGGCGPHKPCRPSSLVKNNASLNMEIDTKTLIEEIDSLNVDTTKVQAPASACDCKNTKDAVDKGCCVVICLKTLETVNADSEHGCGKKKSNKFNGNNSPVGFQNLPDFEI